METKFMLLCFCCVPFISHYEVDEVRMLSLKDIEKAGEKISRRYI